MTELRQTPLAAWHQDHGARMVAFAGYSMPVQYEGVLAEHRAVRGRVGLFDISHMAELRLKGPGARQQLHGLVTNSLRKLAPGRAIYSALCNERGTVLDDLVIYCIDEEDWLVVANASNHDKVLRWFRQHLDSTVELADETHDTALIAVQGPCSGDLIGAVDAIADKTRVLELAYYHGTHVEIAGQRCWVSRTGYTGERGFELYVPAVAATEIWTALISAGQSWQVCPVGLGARDTLRLEAGFCLYGHELNEDTTPLEAGIGWVVKLKSGDFVGREALLRQKEAGVPRRLVGLRFEGRASAREGAEIHCDGRAVGHVTSGTFSPSLERPIALALVEASARGSFEARVRSRSLAAAEGDLPFVPNRARG